MSDRQRYIKPAIKANPELVATAIRRLSVILDLADDGKETVFFSSLGTDTLTDLVAAWSQAALIIADHGHRPTNELLRIAASIDRGASNAVLF